MTFTVTWSGNAESRLARLWTNAPNRNAVTNAANAIDAILRTDAQNVGESRTDNRRIVHEPPLGVIFSVSVHDRKVTVLDVWRYEERGE